MSVDPFLRGVAHGDRAPRKPGAAGRREVWAAVAFTSALGGVASLFLTQPWADAPPPEPTRTEEPAAASEPPGWHRVYDRRGLASIAVPSAWEDSGSAALLVNNLLVEPDGAELLGTWRVTATGTDVPPGSIIAVWVGEASPGATSATAAADYVALVGDSVIEQRGTYVMTYDEDHKAKWIYSLVPGDDRVATHLVIALVYDDVAVYVVVTAPEDAIEAGLFIDFVDAIEFD